MHNHFKILPVITVLSLCGGALSPSSALAAGFYIQEQSASGLGTAFAGQTAQVRDASIIFINPAGMTRLDGPTINFGNHLIQATTDIDDRGGTSFPGAGITTLSPEASDDGDNAINLLVVPNFSVAYPVENLLERPIWAGITVNSPFGLEVDYGEDFIGRFVSTRGQLTTINIAPSLAYEVSPGLSLGGSVNVEYAKATLEQAIPNPIAAGDGLLSLNGIDWEVGINLGVHYEPSERTRFGASYRSGISHEVDGGVEINGVVPAALGGSLPTGTFGARANLDLPDIINFDVAHDVNDKLTVLGGLSWFGWSDFQDIRIEFDEGADPADVLVIEEEFEDTIALRIGAEYQYDDQWTFRGGFQFDESPIETETRSPGIPDADRYWIAAGATYQLSDRLSFDLSGAFITLDEETIADVVPTAAGDFVTDLSIDSNIWIGSFGLNYKF